jgi:fatty acid desaturase
MSNHYLSSDQESLVQAWLLAPMARSEWPTWLVVVAVYGLWFSVLLASKVLGLPLSAVLLWLVSAWHLSLQHELIHGHPTRNAQVNMALGRWPLSLWFPMEVYRASHLLHHRDPFLTLPGVDPESNYVSETTWAQAGVVMRFFYVARKTALGRFLFGPGVAIWETWTQGLGEILAGRQGAKRVWLPHAVATGLLLWFVHRYSAFSVWQYILWVAYPALSLAMVRSHYEHRATLEVSHRIVINEGGWFLRLLFLNNNLHLVHHDLPQLAWYLIPRVYRADKLNYLARNGQFHFSGYASLARRYACTPTDGPVHPQEAQFLELAKAPR